VEQQASAIREYTNLDVAEYFGGETLPAAFDVLVSTPKAFEMAQQSSSGLAWSNFSCVVFDEVHHVLKNHPYRKLAQSLKRSGSATLRLGLSASLSYAVGDVKLSKSVLKLCAELQIEHVAHATTAELQHDGYHAANQAPVVRAPVASVAGILLEADRKPHLMLPTFWARVASHSATPFSQTLVHCVEALEAAITEVDPTFRSPLQKSSSIKTWGAFAHRSTNPMVRQLEPWYEALRLLVVSWEEAEDAATAMLMMSTADALKGEWGDAAETAVACFMRAIPPTFPRFERLKETLIEKLASRGEGFRGIVFVQQRVMTHVLDFIVRTDRRLRDRLLPVCLYASSSPATASLKVSKQEARERLALFASGKSKLLITTVVAEEGMDIPAANVVIRFDSMHHAVSLVQGRGRARQADSDFIVLAERPDRTVQQLLHAETHQAEFIRRFQPALDEGMDASVAKAQRSRELSAKALLFKEHDEKTVLSVLNSYCSKTKVHLDESYPEPLATSVCCSVVYTSALRSVSAVGTAPTKKGAKVRAALQLLALLRNATKKSK
jgi:ERCC4-related helicase